MSSAYFVFGILNPSILNPLVDSDQLAFGFLHFAISGVRHRRAGV